MVDPERLLQRSEKLELWLAAERRALAGSGPRDSFPTDNLLMRKHLKKPTSAPDNLSVLDIKSQIWLSVSNLEHGLNASDSERRGRLLAGAAAGLLRVASRFQLKAGYFIPADPEDAFKMMMIELQEPIGCDRVNALAGSVIDLATSYDGVYPFPNDEIGLEVQVAKVRAKHTAAALHELSVEDGNEAGSWEAYRRATSLVSPVQRSFVGLALTAIDLQLNGYDGEGAMIVEPLPDVTAGWLLRVDRMAPSPNGSRTLVSPEMLLR